MQITQFQKNIERLIDIAANKRTVIMCAEALPWRCHRFLIGDALLILNITVIDIINVKISNSHRLTSFAKVEGKRIVYTKDSLGGGL
jgi:uncharacterized protein (DUF488 family)